MRQVAAALMAAPIVTPPSQQASRMPAPLDVPAAGGKLTRRRRAWRRAAAASGAWKPTHAPG
jgi:hypothetical protein